MVTELAAAATLLILLIIFGAYALGYARARSRSDLGFQAGYRAQGHNCWVWKSTKVYSTIQYTYRGIPIGNPIEHHFRTVHKLNDEVIEAAVAAAASIALKSPLPLTIWRELRKHREAPELPDARGDVVEPEQRRLPKAKARNRR